MKYSGQIEYICNRLIGMSIDPSFEKEESLRVARGETIDLLEEYATFLKKKESIENEATVQKMRVLHDALKNHPYFRSFDMSKADDCFNILESLEEAFYMSAFKEVTNEDWCGKPLYKYPQTALIRGNAHDINAAFCNICLNVEDISDHILSIQGFISLFHHLLSGEETAVLYMKYRDKRIRHNRNYIQLKHKAVESEDGWYDTIVIPRSEKETMLEALGKRRQEAIDSDSNGGWCTGRAYNYYSERFIDLKKENGVFFCIED